MTTDPDPILEGYWKKLLDDWSDDGRHKQFVAYCAQTAQLPEAAVRYRSIAQPAAAEPQADTEAQPATTEETPAASEEKADTEATPAASEEKADTEETPAASEEKAAAEEKARRADAQRRLDGVAAAAVLMLANEPRADPVDAKRLSRKLGLGFLAVVFAVLAYLMWVVFGPR